MSSTRCSPSVLWQFALRTVWIATLLALAACDRGSQSGAAKAAIEQSAETWFEIEVGGQRPRMQLALSPGEQERGLMHRRSLSVNEGMLFVFRAPQQMSFWMRNTVLPLDIGYFDASGVLREVRAMYPLDERPVASQSREIQFCLEMNQGWFAQAGVHPGAKLDLNAVKAAVQARGFSPARFGLER